MFIDQKEGNTDWASAEAKEISHLNEHDSFKDLGKNAEAPEGHKETPCHFMRNRKTCGCAKAQFVAGGHRTDTPIESCYSGVVSLEGICTCTLLAELNNCDLWSADVGNAYLESCTKEKVCF